MNLRSDRLRWWPETRRGRAMLLAILIFALARGVLWASTAPPWWPADEDYHWSYAHYLSFEHAVPDPRERFVAPELSIARGAIAAKRDELAGHPAVAATDDLPRSTRMPLSSSRPVEHPPLAYMPYAVVDWFGGSSSVLTRLYLARLLSAILGVIAVFLTWMLASAVVRNELVAAVAAIAVAAQPVAALGFGSVTNDALAIVMGVAVMLAMVRFSTGPGSSRCALALGITLGVALLSKTTLLALIPVTVAVVAWTLVRDRGAYNAANQAPSNAANKTASHALSNAANSAASHAAMRRSAEVFGPALLIAGPWYLYTLIKYGSLIGNLQSLQTITGGGSGDGAAATGGFLQQSHEWFSATYETFWSQFSGLGFDRGSVLSLLPLLVGLVAAVALFEWLRGNRGDAGQSDQVEQPGGRAPDVERVKILAIITAAALVCMVGPFFIVDALRMHNGQQQSLAIGRFYLPLFPAVAVLAASGLLAIRSSVAQRMAAGTAVLGVAGYGIVAWNTMIRRPLSGGHLGLVDTLEKAARVRPGPVSGGMLLTTLALIALSAAVAAACAALGRRP